MSDEVPTQARELLNAVETLCGEANEAVRLAQTPFEGSQLKEAHRAIARRLELKDQDVLPHLYEKFPTCANCDEWPIFPSVPNGWHS